MDKKYKAYSDELKKDFSGNILEEKIANKLQYDITKLRTDLKILLKNKCISQKIRVNSLVTDNDFLNLLK